MGTLTRYDRLADLFRGFFVKPMDLPEKASTQATRLNTACLRFRVMPRFDSDPGDNGRRASLLRPSQFTCC
jgi:hypothetical protein